MTDIIVLDTSVFLNILVGADVEGRVFQKIIRRCDKVAIQDELVSEYTQTMRHKFKGPTYQIEIRLAELKSLGKLVKPTEVSFRLPDIDDEDRHVVCAAKSAKAKYLITTDARHLWSKRDHIKNSHRIEVLTPEDYLKL